MKSVKNLSSQELMKSVIQRIATGPELSKNISRDEAKQAMRAILRGEVSEVRAAIFLIALRMKRETDDENLGVQDAINEEIKPKQVNAENLINIADPYDGYTRNVPSSVFILPILSELGYACISQGVESVGPKYGCTHHLILKLLGLNVSASLEQTADRLEDESIGWGYIDQKIFAPKLFSLMNLRSEIIKRPLITTLEVLANPLISKKNHFVTGFVHKPYPPIYLMLARNAGFDSSIVIRGTEGGVVPSLRQKSIFHFYRSPDDEDESFEIDPINELDIKQDARAVPFPASISKEDKNDKIETKVDPIEVAKESLKQGMDALGGKPGIMRDCIAYCSAAISSHVSGNDVKTCYKEITRILDSGSALSRFKKI